MSNRGRPDGQVTAIRGAGRRAAGLAPGRSAYSLCVNLRIRTSGSTGLAVQSRRPLDAPLGLPQVGRRVGSLFDLDVAESDLVIAVIAIANAAKTAVETMATYLAAGEPADLRVSLWNRLEGLYGQSGVARKQRIRGASEEREFDVPYRQRSVWHSSKLLYPT